MDEQNITIRQVAKHAGVSVGTVSRVLNGFPNIASENMQRVQEAIEQLGYRQCDSAKLLASRRKGSRHRTSNIGVLFTRMASDWAGHPLVSVYMSGIESICKQESYHPLLEFDDSDQIMLPRFLLDRKVDGVLIKGPLLQNPSWLEQMAREIPVVGMDMYESSMTFPQVAVDNRIAGLNAAKYLWQKGHRRIGYVSLDALHRSFLVRRQGIEEFLLMQGVPASSIFVCETRCVADTGICHPEIALPDLKGVMDTYMALPSDERPTALIAGNDWCAAGLCNAITDCGLKVGQDISVIGFDNVVSLCCSRTPSLTSYATSVQDVACRATRLLMDKIQSNRLEDDAGVHLVSGKMIERHSVATVLI
jgi:LacI family transcriptional regulator